MGYVSKERGRAPNIESLCGFVRRRERERGGFLVLFSAYFGGR
jgi:hypothetical protein